MRAAPFCLMGKFIAMVLLFNGVCFAQTAKVILTSGSSWSAVTNGGNITVECIGGGGGGGEYYSSPASTGGGGGGGEYRKSIVAYTSGSTISYSIGNGGIAGSNYYSVVSTNGGITSWNNGQVLANGGIRGGDGGNGLGGSGGTGQIGYNGGNGAQATGYTNDGGGGGAGGPNGAGVNGSYAAGSGTNFPATPYAGGKGGAGDNGSGGAGGPGTYAGGPNANGGKGTEWTTAGSGGGGGGAGSGTWNQGGTGGNYGGGGGGNGYNPNPGGAGGAGVIIVTYTPMGSTISPYICQRSSSSGIPASFSVDSMFNSVAGIFNTSVFASIDSIYLCYQTANLTYLTQSGNKPANYTVNVGGAVADFGNNVSSGTFSVKAINITALKSLSANFQITFSCTGGGGEILFADPYLLVYGSQGGTGGLNKVIYPQSLMKAMAFPNPTHSATTINYSVPSALPVEVSIYGANGQLVKSVYNGLRQAGQYSYVWNGTNLNGVSVANGSYFFRVRLANGQQVSEQIVVLK